MHGKLGMLSLGKAIAISHNTALPSFVVVVFLPVCSVFVIT